MYKKRICIVAMLIAIIAFLIGGAFWLRWYYEPIPYLLETQMCNDAGDVHTVQIEGEWKRAIDRETTFYGTVLLDGKEYTGMARYDEEEYYTEIMGVYHPVEMGESGTLWLDYRFYEEIGLYVFTYNGGTGAHTYYAPAASVEEYQEALERLETFRKQHME